MTPEQQEKAKALEAQVREILNAQKEVLDKDTAQVSQSLLETIEKTLLENKEPPLTQRERLLLASVAGFAHRAAAASSVTTIVGLGQALKEVL